MELRRLRHAGRGEHRRRDVDVAHEIGARPGRDLTAEPDDQRNVECRFVGEKTVRLLAVIAQGLAMIRRHDDESRIRGAGGERVEERRQRRIGRGNFSQVLVGAIVIRERRAAGDTARGGHRGVPRGTGASGASRSTTRAPRAPPPRPAAPASRSRAATGPADIDRRTRRSRATGRSASRPGRLPRMRPSRSPSPSAGSRGSGRTDRGGTRCCRGSRAGRAAGP